MCCSHIFTVGRIFVSAILWHRLHTFWRGAKWFHMHCNPELHYKNRSSISLCHSPLLFPCCIFLFSGCHTNNIENCWRWAKEYVKKNAHIKSDEALQLQLTVYMWRLWRGRHHHRGVFGQLIADIPLIHPLWAGGIVADYSPHMHVHCGVVYNWILMDYMQTRAH